jgi:ABC-2 type transport system permease protein
MPLVTSLINLLLYNAFFLIVLGVLVLFMARKRSVAFAVLKRNFLGYFANPTGYVFLCIFVLLTSMAAFWPHEFFANNVASLDQLNKWFVYIMLFFIPAITMSIWAEERRQGTDELLLTLPADDFDVVVGKYFAAVAIFTVSLLFSQFATFIVLAQLSLGELDVGLFFTNYLGYWFIGLAMIAIGMVASFLTNNLTVGFILGALFNAPLVFAGKANVISASREASRRIAEFGLGSQFENFSRGVVSIASLAFFVLLAVFGVYLCMVLVGRRHWSGGRNGNAMFFHFFTRVLALAGIVVGGSLLLRNNDFLRLDASEGQVSSLSKTTLKMLKELGNEKPIEVDAFISSEVPENLVSTRFDLISTLREFESKAQFYKVKLKVRINDSIQPKTDDEQMAKDQFGIEPRMMISRERGVMSEQPVLLGAAFRSGLEKVVVPFFEPGIPVEYELIRSLNTVSRPVRKKLGVLKTDANLMGGNFNPMSPQSSDSSPLVTELKKQYDVVEVDPSRPIDPGIYKAILAVQPSSLSPEEMVNFTDAVKAGVPTCIFEDPMPYLTRMPGTGEPKQAGGPMAMFGGGGNQPKGDMRPLWKALGIEVPGEPNFTGGIDPDICWQRYNPYPILEKLQQTTNEWVFVSPTTSEGEDSFNPESEVTKGLKEVLMLYPAVVQPIKDSGLKITTLVQTGADSGRIAHRNLNRGSMTRRELQLAEGETRGQQALAVLVEGEKSEPSADKKEEGDKDKKDAEPDKDSTNPIRAVYVTDADCLANAFFDIRSQSESMDSINFRFQNVTFVLNIIDFLAEELDYPAVRRHVPRYPTLRKVEQESELFQVAAADKRKEFIDSFTAQEQAAENAKNKALKDLEDNVRELEKNGRTDPKQREKVIAEAQKFQVKQMLEERKLAVTMAKLKQERDKNIALAEGEADKAVQKIQNFYKFWAVVLPSVPPLLIGIVVFVSRRLREREGISKSRLK